MLPISKRLFRGQTLLEVLIALALFGILARALFTLVTTTYSVNTFNKSRITARQIAEERIETIRNMPYDDIGTVGGIPSGTLSPTTTINQNDLNYTITTTIIYIDDPFDMTAPDDLLPTDYKRVSVEVSWEGLESSKKSPIRLITDISPKGIEQTTGGGTLSILVVDSNLQPVSQADVVITSTDTTPLINLTIQTGDNGRVLLPGAPPCKKACYSISVSKDGYSSERTYTTAEVANPDKPILSVLQGALTEDTFVIDRVGQMAFTSYSDNNGAYEIAPNTTFTLSGQKTIGTDADDNPVLKYSQTFTTGADGTKTVDNLEWDKYNVAIDSTVGDISGINPYEPIDLPPAGNQNVDFAVSPDTLNSILVTFINPAETPIASVSAVISDGQGFVATASSGLSTNPNFGQVFFDNLSRKIYNFVATASGYTDYSGTLDVYNYKQVNVTLNPL